MIKILPVFIFIFTSVQVFAFELGSDSTDTKKRQAKSLKLMYQAGNVLPTNEFLKGDNAAGKPINYFQGIALDYSIETDGSQYWQQLYKNPSWGFGIYGCNFFNDDELGTPTSIYTHFSAPFIRKNKFTFNYRAKFGFTYNWKPFDPEFNPYNYAIGSYNTVFVDAGLSLGYDLGERFNLALGYSFTHFSNGATRVPNMGINMLAPFLELKYYVTPKPKIITQDKIEYDKNWELILLSAFSGKQLAYDTSGIDSITQFVPQNYTIITISANLAYQINHLVKFGAGLDFGYDEAYNSYITYKDGVVTPQNAGNGSKIYIGIYPSFELVINKVSVVVQPGWYLYRDDPSIPPSTDDNYVIQPNHKPANSYQRIGLKYHILNDLFVGFNVRAFNFSIADYLEWNIGYRFKYNKK